MHIWKGTKGSKLIVAAAPHCCLAKKWKWFLSERLFLNWGCVRICRYDITIRYVRENIRRPWGVVPLAVPHPACYTANLTQNLMDLKMNFIHSNAISIAFFRLSFRLNRAFPMMLKWDEVKKRKGEREEGGPWCFMMSIPAVRYKDIQYIDLCSLWICAQFFLSKGWR